jgi:hypothetical protein
MQVSPPFSCLSVGRRKIQNCRWARHENSCRCGGATPFILNLYISNDERQVPCHFRYHVGEIALIPTGRETAWDRQLF